MYSTGVGISPTSPAPRLRKRSAAGPKSLMLRPCVSTKAHPLASESIPRVGTKGGMPTRVTKKPFTAPAAIPVPRAAVTAVPTPCPAPRSTPATIPARPRTDPTERSMPPVMTHQRLTDRHHGDEREVPGDVEEVLGGPECFAGMPVEEEDQVEGEQEDSRLPGSQDAVPQGHRGFRRDNERGWHGGCLLRARSSFSRFDCETQGRPPLGRAGPDLRVRQHLRPLTPEHPQDLRRDLEGSLAVRLERHARRRDPSRRRCRG